LPALAIIKKDPEEWQVVGRRALAVTQIPVLNLASLEVSVKSRRHNQLMCPQLMEELPYLVQRTKPEAKKARVIACFIMRSKSFVF
jgi:hypothetical protein